MADKMEDLKSYQTQLEHDLNESVPLKEHVRLMEERNHLFKLVSEKNQSKDNAVIEDKLLQMNQEIKSTLSHSV